MVDDTIVGEATHGGDCLAGKIKLGGCAILVLGSSNTVDLLVHLGTVMVSVLTGTRHSEHDARWMPGTDTGDFTQTLMGLARQLLCAPTGSDTLEPVALSDGNGVDHLVLFKDLGDRDHLFKVVLGPVDLVLYRAAVELDLHDVRLLLRGQLELAHLGVADDAHDLAVLGNAVELGLNGLVVVLVLKGILGECLLL